MPGCDRRLRAVLPRTCRQVRTGVGRPRNCRRHTRVLQRTMTLGRQNGGRGAPGALRSAHTVRHDCVWVHMRVLQPAPSAPTPRIDASNSLGTLTPCSDGSAWSMRTLCRISCKEVRSRWIGAKFVPRLVQRGPQTLGVRSPCVVLSYIRNPCDVRRWGLLYPHQHHWDETLSLPHSPSPLPRRYFIAHSPLWNQLAAGEHEVLWRNDAVTDDRRDGHALACGGKGLWVERVHWQLRRVSKKDRLLVWRRMHGMVGRRLLRA